MVAGARATNVVEIHATGVLEAYTTSKTTETRTRPKSRYTPHQVHASGVTVDSQTSTETRPLKPKLEQNVLLLSSIVVTGGSDKVLSVWDVETG